MRVFAYPAFANKHLNPYNALLYESIRPLVDEIVEFRPRRLQRGPIDVLHLHWPDLVVRGGNPVVSLARASAFLLRLAECKARGARIVWTVHNVAPHDVHHARLEAAYWSVFIRLLDGLTFLSAASRAVALAAHPALRRLPYAVIPHGHYKPLLNGSVDRAQACDSLGLPPDRFIFLYFGLVRDYKNVPLLIREFLALGRADAFLVIAGGTGPRERLRTELERLGSGHDNVRLDLRFIPDETLHAYLAACDCVVLPYRQVLNSGSVLLALSAARPVTAPAVGSLVEIGQRVGAPWLHGYAGEFDKSVLLEAMERPRPQTPAPDLSFFEWEAIAAQTVDFYRCLTDRGGR
jgi:glycosyltransferase involved in cell wall biosynthesis